MIEFEPYDNSGYTKNSDNQLEENDNDNTSK
jgi:hypothetical protein